MPPRIVTISDHVDCPTGFGVQHRHLAAALAAAGYDVHSLGLWDARPLGTISNFRFPISDCHAPGTVAHPVQSAIGNRKSEISFTRYPGGMGADDHRRAWAMYRELLRPDLVITLGDFEMFRHLNAEHPRPYAWCHWLPLDALPYPAEHQELYLRYDRLVLMSRFGLEVVRPHLEGRVPLHYIPHGVDTRRFQPHDDPLALRARWSERLGAELRPSDFVLIARDTNQWRKQQPLLLDALARLPRDVKLIFHCAPVAHPNARGWDLPRLARAYGVADRVVFTAGPLALSGRGRGEGWPSHGGSPFPLPPPSPREGGEAGGVAPALAPEELAELDSLADLRVSATAGEGFGVITIEAMACGTPSLITDCTTSPELVLGTLAPAASSPPTPGTQHPTPSPALVDPFGPAGELVRVAAWVVESGRHLFRAVPDPSDLAARILALRRDPGRLARYATASLRRVLASYTLSRMASDWAALARRIL